eukprot:scaffold402_cov21-Tisochrysis_lutea.AAC.4
MAWDPLCQPPSSQPLNCVRTYVQGPNGLQPATWAAAFEAIRGVMAGAKGDEIKAIAGKLTDAETMVATKDLLN